MVYRLQESIELGLVTWTNSIHSLITAAGVLTVDTRV